MQYVTKAVLVCGVVCVYLRAVLASERHAPEAVAFVQTRCVQRILERVQVLQNEKIESQIGLSHR